MGTTASGTTASTKTQPSLRVQVRRVFQASPERVFRAWTTPEELMRWHAPVGYTCTCAEIDLRVGGRYRIGMKGADGVERIASGTYREIDPPRRLSYSWHWEKPERTDLGDSSLTIECLPHGTGTELVLTHEGFLTEDARRDHEKGWTSIVGRLEGVV
jgi:uncharacterized protein YndB with AHSA1/START domain